MYYSYTFVHLNTVFNSRDCAKEGYLVRYLLTHLTKERDISLDALLSFSLQIGHTVRPRKGLIHWQYIADEL